MEKIRVKASKMEVIDETIEYFKVPEYKDSIKYLYDVIDKPDIENKQKFLIATLETLATCVN